MTTQKQDPDLLSLESSLDAIDHEQQQANKYGPHSAGVYYYLCFLALIFFILVLAAINNSRTHDPQLVSWYKTSRTPQVESQQSSVEIAETPVTEEARVAKTSSKASFGDPWNYSTYTPEQLQKIANQLQSNPSPEFNITRAEVFSFLGFYDDQAKLKKDSQNFASLSLKTNSADPRFNRAMALTYLINDQADKAKPHLPMFVGKLNDSLSQWVEGYEMIKHGNTAGGVEKMEQIRKKDPMFYPASYVLIQEHLRQNHLAQAREIIEFWRAKLISNLSFVHYTADLLDRQQQYVELLYYLNSFEKLYPKDWAILYYSGKGNLKLQKKDLARNYYRRILDAPENYSVDQIGKTYFETGKMALFDNDYKASVQDFFQASQRMPNDQNVKFYLASAYFKNDDFENAINVYKQMLTKDQYDPKIRIYLGMAYFEVGQYKLAEKNLVQVYNQGYDEPLLLYYLAKVEEQKGDTASAIQYLQNVVAVDPKNSSARKMLEKLKSQPAPAAPAAQ